jgi:hypothetical protein
VPTPKPRRDDMLKALVRRAPVAAPDRERPREVDHRPCGAGARHERHACRLLPLTCLAPDIVEAILDGRQPKGQRLAEMLGNGPLAWDEQRMSWGTRFADGEVVTESSTDDSGR